jgi:hypothetical protein
LRELPPTLRPNSVEIITGTYPTLPASLRHPKLMSNTRHGRSLKLNFISYPLNKITPTKICNGAKEQMGFNLAWDWYQNDLEGGLLAFNIPANHAVRSQSKWFEESVLWMCTKLIVDTSVKLNSRIDFVMFLRPALRGAH